MPRLLLTLLPLVLLTLLMSQINHVLAPWHVSLFVGGLLVIFTALQLDFDTGFAAVFLTGLLCDAASPVRFGTHAFLFATAHTLIFSVRSRLPRGESLVSLVFALLANLGMFLALSLLLVAHTPLPFGIWPRLLINLLCSQAFLALIAPWFFALQARTLAFDGFEPRDTSRRLT
jgi:rod shape-determining protein MreD